MITVHSIPPDHETAACGADAGEKRRQRADYNAALEGELNVPIKVCLLMIVGSTISSAQVLMGILVMGWMRGILQDTTELRDYKSTNLPSHNVSLHPCFSFIF